MDLTGGFIPGTGSPWDSTHLGSVPASTRRSSFGLEPVNSLHKKSSPGTNRNFNLVPQLTLFDVTTDAFGVTVEEPFGWETGNFITDYSHRKGTSSRT